ncbi:e1-E2 ATPase domain-containing protein [Ditylenchus destructor]|nr:e1-E2 ATPase domain-containing protein [Ditylenchus destructor]
MGGKTPIVECNGVHKEANLSVWERVVCKFRRKKVGQKVTSSVRRRAKTRDLSGAFCEHTWDMDQIDDNFPNSHINIHNIASSKGLSTKEAEYRLAQNGPNALPKPKEISNFELFLRQFWNLLWALLIGASTLSLLQFFLDTSELVNLWITLILYGMIVVMCTISWYQEMEARKVVRGFQNLMPETCLVIRDGKESYLSAQQLVVGDIIRIKSGIRVPADARVLQCSQLKLESSSITGEAEPNDYQWEEVAESVSIFEAHNVAFNGSLCVDGDGLAIVIRVARNTVIGQIADLTTGQGGKPSRLEMQVGKYVKFLVILACSVATIAFLIGGTIRKWRNVVGLLANGFLVCAIGMVPCGLPATVTSILTVIARRLASKKVYLKRLDICEALGQVSIIASDKTGTLTKNVMTVTDVWYGDEYIAGLPLSNKTTKDRKSVQNYDSPMREILTCMTVCNAAKFMADEKAPKQLAIEMGNGKDNGALDAKFTLPRNVEKGNVVKKMVTKQASGTPSEVAMLQYADCVIDTDALRNSYNIVFEIPFNSRRKWHLMIIKIRPAPNNQHEYLLLMKGASEILIEKCSTMLWESGERPMDAVAKDKFHQAYDTFADSGRRVIGFAQKTFVADSNLKFDADAGNFPTEDLTFLGTCAIMDPPRDETAGAIAQCRQAGIKVFMVTGDHHLTATAIARQIGLIQDVPGQQLKDYEILHGEKISHLSDKEWDALMHKRSLVFARTTPEQKLMIVEQCQKRNQLIAMTGDGVNDAPALKKADIGIAMGSGSEVAKQAADVILMDDNFSSIVLGVEEGRLMYDNIKKLLGYTMPHSFPEVWPIIINFCFGFPVGITALQILCIDLGSEILPGISLEGDVMKRPPRRLNNMLVSNTILAYAYVYIGQIQSLGCFLAYCYVFWSHGINISDLWMSALTCWHKYGETFYSNGRAFTVDEQLYINRQACSAWQMGIVFGQFWNIWNTRTRRMSLFKHGIFANKSLLVALVVELFLINLYVYMPGFNEFIGGAPIPWPCWLIVAGVGLYMFAFNEMRKFCIRRWSRNKYVRWFKW